MTVADNASKPPAPSFLQRYWFGIPLWVRIMPALVLGAVVGLVLGPDAVAVKWIGDIFVRLTRMLVVPLVFLTICAGVIALGDPKRLGVGFRVIGIFAFTAGISALIGPTLGIVFQPGVGVDMMGATPEMIRSSKTLPEQLLSIIPINPVQAMVEGDVLAIIFFASLFAQG